MILTAALIYFEGCLAAYWPANHGQRRPLQRMGRDRLRPGMRHNRHIQPHHGYPRPPPSRLHRPGPPPPGPPGHRRASRPPPPQFRQTTFSHPPQHNQGALLVQPMIQSSNNILPHHPHHHHPPQHKELGVPPPYFQQDEIIQEQSKHFPVTTIANPNQLHFPGVPNSLKESQPHGYLSSTYKGWKPIVKPYQNSYMTPAPGLHHQSPAYGMLGQGSSLSHSSQPALNLDTLFREQTEHMKNHGLKQAFSENKGVRVRAPAPPPQPQPPLVKPIKAVELALWNKRFSTGPNHDQQQHQNQQQNQQQNVEQVKKPFNRPKLQPKSPPLQPTNSDHPPPGSLSDNNAQEGPKFPKFKFRQRPRPVGGPVGHPLKQDAAQESVAEHVTSVLPPFPHKHHSEGSHPSQGEQQSPNPKPKSPIRGRVRVRTKPKPELSSGEESAKSGQQQYTTQPGSTRVVESSSSESYPGRRNPQPGPQYGRPAPPTSQEGSGEEIGLNHSFDRNPSAQSDGRVPQPQQNRGHYRPQQQQQQQQHHTEQRIRKPVSNLSEKESFSDGSSDSKENSPVPTQPNPPTRGRRKRPKDGNKNKISSSDPNQQQSHQPLPAPPPQFPEEDTFVDDDSYFPPGFHADPSKNTGKHPVSFVTMPGGKPQVIHHNTFLTHQHQQQPLYPINVMRSPEYQRPGENYGGGGPNGNYATNNRPHFTTINVQNGPGHHQHHHRHGQQQHSHLPPPPPRFPPHQQNSGPVFTSNSNHEPAYFPVAFGSSHVPHTFGNPSHSQNQPPPQHNMLRRPPMTPPPPQYSSHPPMNFPPPPAMASTTMRYPRYHSSSPPTEAFTSPPGSSSSSSFSSVEMSDSSESAPFTMRSVPPSSSTPAFSFPPEFRRQPQNEGNNPERSNAPTISFPEYAPAYSGSGEYDKIPMQFMEQLRPILRDNHHHVVTSSQSSSDIHPPSSFFEEFFQPFDQSFNPNAEQELDSKPTSVVENQQPQYNNNFNNYESYNGEASSSSPQFVRSRPENPSTPKYLTSSSSHAPIYSQPEVVSSSVRNEFVEPESNNRVVWSKLQEEQDSVVSSTEQTFSTSSQSQPKKYNKVQAYQNSGQYESTTIPKTRTPPSKYVPKQKPETVYEVVDSKTEENIIFPPVTTYKPRFQEEEQEEEDDGLREFGLKKYPTTSSTTATSTHEQDDNVDSNTPKSVRYPVRDDSQKSVITTASPESTSYKSRRHFRRRRPDATVRRRFFSSRVKSVADEEQQQQAAVSPKSKSLGRSTTPVKAKVSGHKLSDQTPEESEFQVSPLMKQRRLLQRRKNLNSASVPATTSTLTVVKGIDDASFTTTPSQLTSAEADTVTYGESQWFRIKPTDSSELEIPVGFNTNSKPDTTRLRSGTDINSKNKDGLFQPQLLPLEPSSEVSSTEAGVKTLYSSKHSVSYVDERKFPVHTRKKLSWKGRGW